MAKAKSLIAELVALLTAKVGGLVETEASATKAVTFTMETKVVKVVSVDTFQGSKNGSGTRCLEVVWWSSREGSGSHPDESWLPWNQVMERVEAEADASASGCGWLLLR